MMTLDRMMAGSAIPSVSGGAYNGPDANGAFPSWVNDVGKQYGIKPSTYSGHQTTNRAEAGFAPNPQNFNRGIDWNGSTEDLQRFANFALAHPDLFEQVIWNNPKTGQKVGIAGGRIVDPSYYADDWGGHTDHVHTRFSKGFSLQSFDTGGPVPQDMAAWLHGGEHVLNPDQVDALGGQQGVADMLAAATGGSPDDALARTMGYFPAAAAGNVGGVAGTSSLAGLFDLGNQAVGGLIDTGASLAQMAVQAGMAAGTFGGSAAAGPAAGAAAGYGIQLAATEGKRLASYGFQMGAIVGDALIEQLFPFGAPRWLGYDYTQFLPQLNISEIGTTTVEKAMQQQLQAAGVEGPATGLDTAGMMSQLPGGPVNAATLPGSQPAAPPTQAWADPGVQTPSGPPGTGPGGSAPPGSAAPVQAPQMPAPSLLDIAPFSGGAGQMSAPQSLLPPIFNRDEGGWLPDGSLAFNTSGRDEFVLSAAQLDAAAIKPAVANSRGGDVHYHINGRNPDEIAREIASKQRLLGLQHTGRPMSL